MEFNQLIQFKAIAELESISKAADKLYISQPALSQTLQRLENELGVKLFDRTKNRIHLNKNGKVILEYANKIIDDIAVMKAQVRGENDKKNELTFASSSPSAIWYITSIYYSYNQDMLSKSVILPQNDLKDALVNGDVDIALSFEQIENKNIYNIPFSEIRYFLTVPQMHPLANRKSIHLNDLKGYTFLSINDNYSSITHNFNETLKEHGISFTETNDLYLFYQALQTGHYLNFAKSTEIAFQKQAYANRIKLQIKDFQPKHTLYIAYLKSNKNSIAPFKQWMHENYKDIMI